jgi:hypothetical protein
MGSCSPELEPTPSACMTSEVSDQPQPLLSSSRSAHPRRADRKGKDDPRQLSADPAQPDRRLQPEIGARAGDQRAAESDVQAALEELRSRVLVLETYGASGRVLRYAQNFGRVYGVPTGQRRAAGRSWRCAARRRSASCAPTASACTALTTVRRSKPISMNWRDAAAAPSSPGCRGRPAPANSAGRTCSVEPRVCRAIPPQRRALPKRTH